MKNIKRVLVWMVILAGMVSMAGSCGCAESDWKAIMDEPQRATAEDGISSKDAAEGYIRTRMGMERADRPVAGETVFRQ